MTLDDYRRGSGLIQTFAPGWQPTLRDLVRQMTVTSANIGTAIVLKRVGLAQVTALLAQLGSQQTRINHTTAALTRRVFVLADPQYRTVTDRELYTLGLPPVPPDGLPRPVEPLARDPTDWLGRSTARERSWLLRQLLGGELASAAPTAERLDVWRGQCYDSRVPRCIKEQAPVAHETGEIPPVRPQRHGHHLPRGGADRRDGVREPAPGERARGRGDDRPDRRGAAPRVGTLTPGRRRRRRDTRPAPRPLVDRGPRATCPTGR
jgi:hypothetical protein